MSEKWQTYKEAWFLDIPSSHTNENRICWIKLKWKSLFREHFWINSVATVEVESNSLPEWEMK